MKADQYTDRRFDEKVELYNTFIVSDLKQTVQNQQVAMENYCHRLQNLADEAEAMEDDLTFCFLRAKIKSVQAQFEVLSYQLAEFAFNISRPFNRNQ